MGGDFRDNKASYGGFLFKREESTVLCSEAIIERHEAIEGGAIYAMDESILDWRCDLVENTAVSGPAM